MVKALVTACSFLSVPCLLAQVDTVRVDTTWKTVIMTTPQADPAVDTVMIEPEVRPEFPGGEQALHRYVAGAVRYPEVALESGIQGRVFVDFIVEKDGRVGHAAIRRGVHPALDEEALRVVRAMPDWSPGRMNGEPVRTSFVLPVTFALK